MGISFTALKDKAQEERAAHNALAFNTETVPASRWGDVGYAIERRVPWLRGWIKVTVALGAVLAIFALLVWLVLWWGAALASAPLAKRI